MKYYRLVILSALLYVLPFIYPEWCAELVFVAFVPLIRAFIESPLTVRSLGFIWGLCTYGILFLGVLEVLLHYSNSIWSIVGYPFLVIYGSLTVMVAGYLYLITQRFSGALVGIIMVLWFLLLFNDYVFFTIFGQLEGNRLLNPLVPLAVRPSWLYIVQWIGQPFGLLLIAVTNAVGTYSYFFSSKSALRILLLLMVGWGSGWVANYRNIPTQSLELEPKFGVIVPHKKTDESFWEYTIEIAERAKDLTARYPSVRVICMPESAFPFFITSHSFLRNMWIDFIPDDVSLVMGSQREEQGKIFNSLFCIKQGKVVNYYDKCHRMFFIERLPFLSNYLPGLARVFDSSCVDAGTLPRSSFKLDDCFYIPYLCSELFFTHTLTGCQRQPLICLVNDNWFKGSYIPKLMALYAAFMAYCTKRVILYVGYHHVHFYTSSATEMRLAF